MSLWTLFLAAVTFAEAVATRTLAFFLADLIMEIPRALAAEILILATFLAAVTWALAAKKALEPFPLAEVALILRLLMAALTWALADVTKAIPRALTAARLALAF